MPGAQGLHKVLGARRSLRYQGAMKTRGIICICCITG